VQAWLVQNCAREALGQSIKWAMSVLSLIALQETSLLVSNQCCG